MSEWFVDLPDKAKVVIAIAVLAGFGLLAWTLLNLGDTTKETSPQPTSSTSQASDPASPSSTPSDEPTDTAMNTPSTFSGPLPVPAKTVNALIPKSIKAAAILENRALTIEKKQKALAGLATTSAVAGLVGSDEPRSKPPKITFSQAVSINKNNVVFELKVDGVKQYMSFINVGGDWLANAYGGQIGVS